MQEKQPQSQASLERQERTQWFRDARFGMFIHWGLYAIPARGEWVRSVERMTIGQYQQYFDEFDPVNYNPTEWARLAKRAGMKYAVLTAKHHDGFCLFDTRTTDYNAVHTPAGRDLVREYVDAFRAEGLKVGLYYSLVDWHHEDYPVKNDWHHPMRDVPEICAEHRDMTRYVDYMHKQVRELCTNYGKLDILWFDFSYDTNKGEAWRATELVNMVRRLQPGIIIDNRLGGNMRAQDPDVYAGDFHGPEQGIPSVGEFDDAGWPIPWEACCTMNDAWGYAANDHNFKNPAFIIRMLADCVSKGGNLMINVGPTPYGEIPPASAAILREIGTWMDRNSKSIYGCGPSAMPKPDWGRYTQRGNKLYAHVLDQNLGHLLLKGLRGKIQKARLLSDGSEIPLSGFWNAAVDTFEGPDDYFMNFGAPVHSTYPLPDPADTVIEITLKE